MKNQRTKGILIGFLALSLWNCKTSDPAPSPYESGAYVVNAGNFLDNNGSISFIPRGATTASTDIFNTANARTLTGSVQDYTEIDGKGVILVDNSTAGQDKIEIVESGTFKSLGTLQSPDVENPRYVIAAGPNKAYVSCWDATGSGANFYAKPGYVLVVNLLTRTVVKKITVTKGAERMVLFNKQVFVGSAGGDRVVTVINTDTDEVVASGLDVGVNTDPVAIDANNKLWAYTSSTNEMVRLDPTTKLIEIRLKVGSDGKTPGPITISADKLAFFFVNSFYDPADNYKQKGETYRFSIDNPGALTTLSTTQPFINRLFTGLGVDPQTGYLYAGVTPSYKQAGYVLRYKVVGGTGVLIDSVKAEIAPSRFFFR